MPRPKKVGAPPKYVGIFAEHGEHLALLGATNADLARAFGVTEKTIKIWQKSHPAFGAALRRGKFIADAKVAKSLYQRALGYEHEAVKIFCNKDGEVTEVPYIERYPPDTTACIFWLKNRRKDLWRDRMEFVEPDWDALSDEQLEAIASGKAQVRPAEGDAPVR